MIVSPITFIPVTPILPVKRVERSKTDDTPFEAVEALPSGDRKPPKRKRPVLAYSRGATEKSSASVLTALAQLKLGG